MITKGEDDEVIVFTDVSPDHKEFKVGGDRYIRMIRPTGGIRWAQRCGTNYLQLAGNFEQLEKAYCKLEIQSE